jgi:1-acyl-sn-glycerol-3-phosphate acyltransferase
VAAPARPRPVTSAATRRGALEPWYRIAKAVLLPPNKLWFNWRLEGVDRIPSSGPVIVAGNHLSYLDPFAHAYFVVEAGRRPRFLAKRELFDNWFTGMVLRGAGQIPVDRGSGDNRPLLAAADALGRGEVVVIYPEGTSQTEDPRFRPSRGKTGVARLALMTGVPVVPVATWGGQYVWRRSGRQSLRFGRPIWVAAGEPIDLASSGADPEDRDATQALTDGVMSAVSALVDDLGTRYPQAWRRG